MKYSELENSICFDYWQYEHLHNYRYLAHKLVMKLYNRVKISLSECWAYVKKYLNKFNQSESKKIIQPLDLSCYYGIKSGAYTGD